MAVWVCVTGAGARLSRVSGTAVNRHCIGSGSPIAYLLRKSESRIRPGRSRNPCGPHPDR